MPILFLGLVVIGIDKFPKLVAALAGAGATLTFAGLPNRAGLMVGALAGTLVGTLVEKTRRHALTGSITPISPASSAHKGRSRAAFTEGFRI